MSRASEKGQGAGGGSGLIALAIARPVSVLSAVILVVMFGLMSLAGIPIQLTPDIEVPTLTVSTNWPGAAPADVEREILQEQEEVLEGLRGLERMLSEATSDSGSVTLEFEVGTDLDDALVRVTNRLVQVPAYPENADQPVVSTSGGEGPPLAVVLIRHPDGEDVSHHRTWADGEVLPSLERIPGVAKIDFFGGQDSQVEIQYDAHALAARGVTLEQLVAATRASLGDRSGGILDIGKRRYVVRTLAQPEALEDLGDVVIAPASEGRAAVRLRDVATVQLGLRIRRAYVYGNQHEALALLFRREAGSNVLEVTEAIKAELARLQEDVLAPRGLMIDIVSDQTTYINGALDLVRNNLLLGGALAALVLLFFLRSFAAAGIISIAIPICVIGTALGMVLLGRTVNVVSLAGMAFAVGMVVDAAIVVLENIDAFRKEGAGAAEAALEGTREVWGALIASTLTTAAVFLPIIAWDDQVGYLLRDIAVAISVAVLLSLAVSVLVIPSFAARLLPDGVVSRDADLSARLGHRLREGIATSVLWITKRAGRAALVAFTVPTVMAVVGLAFLPPMEYLPTGNRNFLFGVMIPPPGYSVPEMMRVGQQIQNSVGQHIGVEVDGIPAVRRSFFVARPGLAFMGGAAEDSERIGELVQFYRGIQRTVPGFFGIASQASLFGRGIGSSRSVDIDITGSDLGGMVAIGGRMMGMIQESLPGAQARPVPSLDLGNPELQVRPRREEVARLGMSVVDVGGVVDALVDGRIIGELGQEGRDKLDVVVRPPGGGVPTAEALRMSPIATPAGVTVPLATLADIGEGVGPATIRRVERRRAITLQVSPPDDMALETALDVIQTSIVAPLEAEGLGEGTRISLSGNADDLAKARGRLGEVLLLAVIISFFLLSALYEDFLAPVIVLITVPLAGAGGVLGLRLVDATLSSQPFDMMTAMGFIILIGVVVNNAILVVDVTLAKLRQGLSVAESLAEGVRRRTRPIAMSVLTSLAGLLPLVVFSGSGSELYRGVGAIVLGGLALSTVLTLFVVPAVFATAWRLAGRA